MGKSSRIRSRAAESRRSGPQPDTQKPSAEARAEIAEDGTEQLLNKDKALSVAVDRWREATGALYVTGVNHIGLVDWEDPAQKELGDAIAAAAKAVADRLSELGYEVNDGLISQMPFWGGSDSKLPQEGIFDVRGY